MYHVMIKGITHDWIISDTFANKEKALEVYYKAIKAGRKESHIKVVFNDGLDEIIIT